MGVVLPHSIQVYIVPPRYRPLCVCVCVSVCVSVCVCVCVCVCVQGLGVWSDCSDLHYLCRRKATELKWTSSFQPIDVSDAVVADPSVSVEATLHQDETSYLIQPRTSRQTLLQIQRAQNLHYWSSLKLQGNMVKLAFVDHTP